MVKQLATGFYFVAAQTFLGFGLFGLDSFDRAILHKFDFIGGVHRILGRVIMALLTSFAYQSDNFPFVAFFRHNQSSITDMERGINTLS